MEDEQRGTPVTWMSAEMGVLPEAYGRETDRQRIVLQVTESWQGTGNEDRQIDSVSM